MFAINQAKSITELNQLSLKLGYFHVNNAGSIFLIKRNIVMEGQENPNLFNLCRFKIFEDKKTILRKDFISISGYIFANRGISSKIKNIALNFQFHDTSKARGFTQDR